MRKRLFGGPVYVPALRLLSLCFVVLGFLQTPSAVHASCGPTITMVPVSYEPTRTVLEVRLQNCEEPFRSFGLDLTLFDLDGFVPHAFALVDVDVAGTLVEGWAVFETRCFGDGSECDRFRMGGFDATGFPADASGVLCRLVLTAPPIGAGRLALSVFALEDDAALATVVLVSEVDGVVSTRSSTWGVVKSLFGDSGD